MGELAFQPTDVKTYLLTRFSTVIFGVGYEVFKLLFKKKA